MASNSSTQSNGSAARDTAHQQVGTVYAKAILGAAEATGQTEALLAELDSLVEDVLDKLPKLQSVLFSGLVSHEDKVKLLDRSLSGSTPGSSASPLMLNFLKVLSAHGRLNALRAIHRAAHKLHDQMRGRVRVYVQTATPLEESQAQRLSTMLRGMLGSEPVLERVTNPDLIGGVVLRVGDTVYDGSVSAQLEQVRTQMIHRSVHEIQSRRDRFSHSV
jgi:F-type H+-transporting ATPase subunit delta